MRKLVYVFAFALTLSFAFAQGPDPTQGSERMAEVIIEASQAGWLQISPETAIQRIDTIGPVLIDVRTQSEWDEQGHIPDAILIPVTELALHHDLLPADLTTPIIIYCAAGTRGNYGMTYLKLLGYENVTNMAGGFRAWVEQGLPVIMNEGM